MTPKLSSLWRNLLAMVYDTCLIAPLLMANSFVWVTIFGPTANASEPTVPAWLMQFSSATIVVTFFTLFWCKSGQTLGMQAWRIQLQTTKGARPRAHQCLLRCCIAVPALLFRRSGLLVVGV